MKTSTFQEIKFRNMVDKALDSIKRVLDVNRNPIIAGDHEDHTYNDKFALAELLTNTAIAANMNVLERIGLTQDKLAQLHSMIRHDKQTVTLRMEAQDTCLFLCEKVVKVVSHSNEGEIHTETTKSGIFGKSIKKQMSHKFKVVNKVKEYHWKVGITYKIFCYGGPDPTKNVVHLQSGSNSSVIITKGSSNPPLPKKTVKTPSQVCINWILQNININFKDKKQQQQWACTFKIDRSKEDSCRTPRRNQDIDEAFSFFRAFKEWEASLRFFFTGRVEDAILRKNNPANDLTKKPLKLADISHYDKAVFCPVVPLMENRESTAGTATFQQHSKSLLVITSSSESNNNDNNNNNEISPLLPTGDIDKLLNEQCRSLDKVISDLSTLFPQQQQQQQQQRETNEKDSLIALSEARLFLLLGAGINISQCWFQSIDYIEHLLTTQLKAAIGKEIKATDFDEFMAHHNRQIFAPQYQPKPFCYAIRRPNHYPDGLLTIEASSSTKEDSSSGAGNKDKQQLEPCFTFVRHIPGDVSCPISIPLNAATTIEMKGDRYLHGWMHHKFGSESKREKPTLAARARQFSCFLLMVGTMSGSNSFQPKDAIIVQNKDEVLIPLLLEDLPSAKEFKDAISSLSPEQQRFAKAFRGMQLASSVFGVCVIQLKPQLELLLGLPEESLTKEIELTQDLMSLFLEYQIPSDLLSYDGDADASLKDKVDVVKNHVKSVMDVIEKTRKKELEEKRKEAEMNVYNTVSNRYDDTESEEEEEEYELSNLRRSGFLGSVEPDYGAAQVALHSSRSFPVVALARSAPGSMKSLPVAKQASRNTFRKKSARSSALFCGPSASLPPGQNSAPIPTLHSGTPERSIPPSAQLETDTFDSNAIDSSPSLLDLDNAALPDNNDIETKKNFPSTNDDNAPSSSLDFTSIPKQLDAILEEHDKDGALCSTIIKATQPWNLQRQPNLLSKPIKTTLDDDKCRDERNKAYDLLDALSRSGSLPISCAELHVVVAVTHQFENDLIETVIQDNVNPIEKVEQSLLLLVSTIQGISMESELSVQQLLSNDHQQIAASSFVS